jgi:hypothetical protein
MKVRIEFIYLITISDKLFIYAVIVNNYRGQLSLVSTIEKLPGRNSSGSDLENRDYDRRDQSR